jgi:hypothetical protein
MRRLSEQSFGIANSPSTIDIHHHYIIELVDARTIAVISIPNSDMLIANGLTKALPQPKHTMMSKRCLGSLD